MGLHLIHGRLAEDFWNLREEVKEAHQKLLEELKEEVFHVLPVQTRVFAIRSRCPPARGRGDILQSNLWLYQLEEDMKTWNGKPTSALVGFPIT